ncbi:carbohydrate kinase [Microcella sp.]|uniref:carbohydrate kinase n=1 Tax=Microcella sp. TaxID=1913979 RepID=UPI00263829E6|nr:carbohydrate kinase [Microcella sp.]
MKLLHAGQRLPVHAHPCAADAARLCGETHGKAEAWYIIRGGEVHLGLREEHDHEGLARLMRSRESDLLAALHRVAVAPGDVVYVTPGTLHSIGAGVVLLEVQEPSDLSIMLEHEPYGLDPTRDGHLGVGYPAVLSAVTTSRLPMSRLKSLVYPAVASKQVLPVEADRYFRLERVIVDRPRRLERGYAVLVVTAGTVSLRAGGRVLEAVKGSTFVAPFSLGPMVATGRGEIIVCRPPQRGPVA